MERATTYNKSNAPITWSKEKNREGSHMDKQLQRSLRMPENKSRDLEWIYADFV